MENTNKRVILYDISNGFPKFYKSLIVSNVSDIIPIVNSSTLELFPTIEKDSIDFTVRYQSTISAQIIYTGPVITGLRPLVSCITMDISEMGNGNIYYRDRTIIKYGDPKNRTGYKYCIVDDDKLTHFGSVEEACAYIDKYTN